GTPEQHVFLIRRVAFSRDGKTALVASSDLAEKDADDVITVWDVEQGTPRRTLVVKKALATALAVSPDGKFALGGTYAEAGDTKTCRLVYWALPTGKAVHDLPADGEALLDVAFSGDGTKAVSGGTGKAVQVWDLKAGKAVQALDAPDTVTVAFSPDGARVLT